MNSIWIVSTLQESGASGTDNFLRFLLKWYNDEKCRFKLPEIFEINTYNIKIAQNFWLLLISSKCNLIPVSLE